MDVSQDTLENVVAAEADHRIANHMSMLSSYVRLKVGELAALPEAPEKTSTLRLVESIGAQIAAVAELHRMLTHRGRLPSANIGAQLERLCDAFRAGPGCRAEILYEGDPDCLLPVRKVLPVSQIVSEAVTNALKYGCKAGLTGKVTVSCRRQPEGGLLITVADSGVGFAEGGGPPSQGVGFQLMQALAAQVEGEIGYAASPEGLTFSLRLPD
ncbi:MAG: hypothetical protein JG765_465 [Cereibacter sp.]|jgi:two-component sensor histidine kinase|nr:hypothetical protein [Cereibacter sp.]